VHLAFQALKLPADPGLTSIKSTALADPMLLLVPAARIEAVPDELVVCRRATLLSIT
jgi:hypothetical protein